MAQQKRHQMPLTAIPNTLYGEAACRFADEIGFDVSTHALRGERTITTSQAREFLDKGKSDGYDYSSAVWIVMCFLI
jgi:hypothetical protein